LGRGIKRSKGEKKAVKNLRGESRHENKREKGVMILNYIKHSGAPSTKNARNFGGVREQGKRRSFCTG